ncbi:MAG: nickel-dependent hydrogenase large subunit, partial [Candidatus Obscuribacterales bacterium]|nr:nickel-dependent hydrogenase large subunit [Candidatus Obscuribacterales bacterium]
MSDVDRKIIEIPEICRVEGHSAVTVDIEEGQVTSVKLDIFEGTRFFERIVLGHRYDQIPHITSRVCAICSTGHVLAAIFAIERAFNYQVSRPTQLYRELMHLGMMIESHATHICALALPDFLKTPDLVDFATKYPGEFAIWTKLRKLGATIQTVVGGRPFHPVNLHVGGLSALPSKDKLALLKQAISDGMETAATLCELLLSLELPFERTFRSPYLALIPHGDGYGFFGERVQSSEGWQAGIDDYKNYLGESVVAHSHAKRSTLSGKPFMVGAMARLSLFGERLSHPADSFYRRSPLALGQTNTILNNLAQS